MQLISLLVCITGDITSSNAGSKIGYPDLTHCGRVTQFCVFNTVKLGNSVHLQVLLSATPQGGMFPEVSHPQALLGSLMSIS